MQVTIYVDESLLRAVDERARRMKMSRSRLIQHLLRTSLEKEDSGATLSAWGSIPELDSQIREHLGADVPRESLG